MKKSMAMLMVGISAVVLQGNAAAKIDEPEMTDVDSEALTAESPGLELCLKRCSEVNYCRFPGPPPHSPFSNPAVLAAYRVALVAYRECVNRRNQCEVHCYNIYS
ncbi:hypothetical protein WMF11_25895 [Sorangium sp. So ce295]|uniref:hypothetical protein n=1 Tax=Sorangium sp. So ce295 TaxID=3133295 RepID=UPI003F610A77